MPSGTKTQKIVSLISGLLIGVGLILSIYFLFLYDGKMSMVLRILIPVIILGLGVGGYFLSKKKSKNAEPQVDERGMYGLIEAACRSVAEGKDGKQALLDAVDLSSDPLQSQVRIYLEEGTGVLRTWKDRDLLSSLEQLMSGDEAGATEILRRVYGEEKSTTYSPWSTLVIAGVILVFLVALVASGIKV